MPKELLWTSGQDTQIRRLRSEGASWEAIAVALSLARWSVMERARALGAADPSASATPGLSEREPLAAGHTTSWDAITRGTSLECVPFRTPSTIR
jgi:hypothetical protein